MMKTIGSMNIDWTGFKRVLIHTGIVAAATIVAYIISSLKNYNFGTNEAYATIILTFVGTFAEKFFGSYDVPLQVSNTPTV